MFSFFLSSQIKTTENCQLFRQSLCQPVSPPSTELERPKPRELTANSTRPEFSITSTPNLQIDSTGWILKLRLLWFCQGPTGVGDFRLRWVKIPPASIGWLQNNTSQLCITIHCFTASADSARFWPVDHGTHRQVPCNRHGKKATIFSRQEMIHKITTKTTKLHLPFLTYEATKKSSQYVDRWWIVNNATWETKCQVYGFIFICIC